MVSLVDNELMRIRLASIYETIKACFKANLTARISEATVKAEQVATAAKNANQVLHTGHYLYVWLLALCTAFCVQFLIASFVIIQTYIKPKTRFC